MNKFEKNNTSVCKRVPKHNLLLTHYEVTNSKKDFVTTLKSKLNYVLNIILLTTNKFFFQLGSTILIFVDACSSDNVKIFTKLCV